jgi:predicted glutamine amidotransferase
MCLIIHTQENTGMTREYLAGVWNSNNDGWGILWHNAKGDLRVKKGISFDEFYALYRSLSANHIKNMVIHFRMATQGHSTVEMAHPYLCHDNGIWLVHNGIVSYPHGAYNDTMSDTALMVSQFLRPLLEKVNDPHAFIRTQEFEYMMTEMHGKHNKFIVSDKHGHVVINKSVWVNSADGLLLSNGYSARNSAWDMNYGMGYLGGYYGE